MSRDFSLTHQFLIAMPALQDPNFFHGVTYICEHNEQGAMGILINRPLDITLGEIFRQLDIDAPRDDINGQPVFFGGPVQNERGFVIHHPLGNWETTLPVTKQLGVTSSRDILAAIADGSGPELSLVALGYAGWGPGQLEEEMAQNAWISVPASEALIFSTPAAERWQAAAALGGVDLSRLSGDVGHA